MIAATRPGRKLTALLATAIAALAMALAASPAAATIGLESFDVTNLDRNGDPVTQAASHPDTDTTAFSFTVVPSPPPFAGVPYPDESLKDAVIRLPAGFLANPLATPRCTQAQFSQAVNNLIFDTCPVAAQIGYVDLQLGGGLEAGDGFPAYFPIFNLEVPRGTPAVFGFSVAGTPSYLTFKTRTGDDYGITAVNVNAPATLPILAVRYVLWGVPADPDHDTERGYTTAGGLSCADPIVIEHGQESECEGHTSSAPLRSFLTMPTSCGDAVATDFAGDSWESLGDFATASSLSHDNSEPPSPIGFSGCNALDFSPSLQARPTTTVADAASGLDVDLHIPTHDACDPGPPATCETGEAHLKDAVVTLPQGMAVNPSSANGLGACTEAQLGFIDKEGDTIHTTPGPASCPDASKLGTVTVDTTSVDHPIKGAVYAATPHANPFGSLLAIYISADDPQTGLVIKLAGEVDADPQTGQLTTSFLHNPQLPFEDFHLNFFGGAGGALRTPAVCGTYQTTSSLTPWSAPESGPPATPSDAWAVSQAPGGGNCPTAAGSEPNSPSLDAGTVSPIAASYSPVVVNLRREDGSQNLSSLSLKMPPGLTGKLAGIGICPDAALAAAAQKSGHEELASPSCPAASAVGTVDAAAGAGPAPYWTKGTAYLTGPYKGAPLGVAIVTPAVAGPYDLGTVVVRAALHLDPASGQITADSDPIPQILEGIPLDIRAVQVHLDRSQFTRNGTNCDPMTVSGSALSTLGQTAQLSNPFQLGECSSLAFKPKLSIRLKGGTKRGAHPALTGTLQMPAGGANVARAAVALPHSEFLDQAHIGTVCTRVQFAEGAGNGAQCPPASVYGHVTVTSPLVDYVLEGPVFLRSSEHKLPDLVLALHGPPSQPIAIAAAARIDSVKGGIRTTFEGVPDLPLTQVTLEMEGGKKGLLQNSTNICKGVHKATAELDGQNGKAADLAPALKNSKCAGSRKGHKRHRHTAPHQHAVR